MAKNVRGFWSSILLGFVFDVILSLIIARVYGFDDLVQNTAMIFIGIQVVSLVFALRGLIYDWTAFAMFRTKSARRIALVLAEDEYPAPHGDDDSAEVYFDRIARDVSFSDKIRIDAAVDLGFQKSHGQAGRGMTAIRTAILWDDAIVLLRERAAGI